MSYTHKDFITGKIHKTNGKFKGWTNPTGLLGARYAIFQRPKSNLLVPQYLLTSETLAAIAKAKK